LHSTAQPAAVIFAKLQAMMKTLNYSLRYVFNCYVSVSWLRWSAMQLCQPSQS